MSRSTSPYRDTIEHVEEELNWLQARCIRLSAEAHLRETEAEDNAPDPAQRPRPGTIALRLAKCRVQETRAEEDRARHAIDRRLQAHSRDPEAPVLGLVQVVEEHALSAEEKLVLLVTLTHALGSTWTAKVFGSFLPPAYSGPDVSDIMLVLDPAGLEEHLAARRIFRPKSALMRSNLIVLDPPSGAVTADSLLHLGGRLTLGGLSRLLADVDAMCECAAPGLNGYV